MESDTAKLRGVCGRLLSFSYQPFDFTKRMHLFSQFFDRQFFIFHRQRSILIKKRLAKSGSRLGTKSEPSQTWRIYTFRGDGFGFINMRNDYKGKIDFMQKDDMLRLMRDPNLLPSEKQTLLSNIADQAATLGMPCYIVGGFVRDLLLGKPSMTLMSSSKAMPSNLVKTRRNIRRQTHLPL
jgi:hypothetical protein